MRKFLLGGFTAAGLLLGGFAISGATAAADQPDDTGDVYSCPDGSTSDYKIDNLSGETFTVPQPTAGKVIVAVVVKASTEHKPYDDVEPGVVINVKADMGHNISHAHICEGPPPPPEEPTTTTASTLPPPPPPPEPTTTPAPQAAPSVTVEAAGPVPPAGAPAAAPPAPAQTALPSTGSSSWGLALTALASLLGGLGLVKLSRRTS